MSNNVINTVLRKSATLNLPKIGELRLPIKEGSSQYVFRIDSTSQQSMTGLDGLSFLSGGGAFGVYNYINSNVKGTLCIPDKYLITAIYMDVPNLGSDVSRFRFKDSKEFRYMPALRALSAHYQSFNITDIAATRIGEITLIGESTEAPFVGSLEDIVACMEADTHNVIDIKSQFLTGDLSALAVLPTVELLVNFKNLTGDLHYLGKYTYNVDFSFNEMNYTGSRPTGSYFLITTGNAYIKLEGKSDVENLVINQDNLTFHQNTIDNPYFRNLNLVCDGVTYDDLSSSAQSAINSIKAKACGDGHITIKLNGLVI